MLHQNYRTLVGLLLSFLVWGGYLQAMEPTKNILITKLTELDRFEPFEGQVFHDGHLWVGHSRKDLAAAYKIELFSSDGKLVTTVPLKHSPRFLYAFGSDSILAVGIAASDNLSHYSIIKRTGETLKVTDYKIPAEALADRFVGKPGQMYFTDPGGFDDGGPIGQPLRTLFTIKSGQARFLNARMSGPRTSVLLGNSIFIAQQPDMGSGRFFLTQLNLSSETAQKISSEPVFGVSNMLILENGNEIVFNERYKNQVGILDATKSTVTEKIAIPAGQPRGLGQMGHCLVVGSEVSKQVTFIDLKASGHPIVAQWDVSNAGKEFLAINNLSVDPKQGRVYLRSASPCSVSEACPYSHNSALMVEEESQETLKACNN